MTATDMLARHALRQNNLLTSLKGQLPKSKKKRKLRALKVDLDNNLWDAATRAMLGAGFTHETIAEYTGLPTKARVAYRSRKWGVSSLDYRRGVGHQAGAAIAAITKSLEQVDYLRKKIEAELRG